MAYFTALRIEDHGAGPEQGPVLATASCTFKEQVHYPPGGRQSLPVAPARPSQLRGGGTTEGRGACPRGSRRRPLVPNQEDSTAPTSESTRRTTAVRGAMGIAPRLDLRVLGGQDLRGQEIGELIANHVFLAAAKRLSSRRAVGSADSYAGAARVDPQDPRGRPSGFDSLASCRLRRQLRRGRARGSAGSTRKAVGFRQFGELSAPPTATQGSCASPRESCFSSPSEKHNPRLHGENRRKCDPTKREFVPTTTAEWALTRATVPAEREIIPALFTAPRPSRNPDPESRVIAHGSGSKWSPVGVYRIESSRAIGTVSSWCAASDSRRRLWLAVLTQLSIIQRSAGRRNLKAGIGNR